MNLQNFFDEKESFFYRFSTILLIGFIYYTIFNNSYIQDIPIEQTIFYILIVLTLVYTLFYFYKEDKIIVCWVILVIPVFIYLIYKRYNQYLKNKENEIKLKHMKEFKETYLNENVHINEPRPQFVSVENQGMINPVEQIPKRYPTQVGSVPVMNQPPVPQPSMNNIGLDFNNYNPSSFTPFDAGLRY